VARRARYQLTELSIQRTNQTDVLTGAAVLGVAPCPGSRRSRAKRITVGADNGFDTADFVYDTTCGAASEISEHAVSAAGIDKRRPTNQKNVSCDCSTAK
jgi:hypothetical protein